MSTLLNKRTLWLEDVTIHDIPRVGGKNASLGEMIRELQKKSVYVPGGFCTTDTAYKYYIKTTGLEKKLRAILSDLDTEDVSALAHAGKQCRTLIRSTPFPQDLSEEIEAKYIEMCERFGGTDVDCAVRSSATAEDLPDASFAGQQGV